MQRERGIKRYKKSPIKETISDHEISRTKRQRYGVATMSRRLKIIGPFRKRAL